MMYLYYPAVAFSATTALNPAFTKLSVANGIPNVHTMRSSYVPIVLNIRGGEDVLVEEESPEMIELQDSVQDDSIYIQEEATTTVEPQEVDTATETQEGPSASDSTNQIHEGKTILMSPIFATLKCIGASYTGALIAQPIITKALTACLTFGLSDWTAQRIESKPSSSEITKSTSKIASEPTQPLHNWKRTIFSAAVGLFYFGPAAHYWYEAVFKLLPGTSLFSTVQKALLGQVIFGPVFTCIFFASSLLQNNSFTVRNWVAQIKKDLPAVWLSGLGYWPLVDVISFSLIPIQFIPLFINIASFIWTVYLSLVSNSRAKVQ